MAEPFYPVILIIWLVGWLLGQDVWKIVSISVTYCKKTQDKLLYSYIKPVSLKIRHAKL